MDKRIDYVQAEGRRYFYTLRCSKKAKRLSINVGERGGVEVVVPWLVSERRGRDYARQEAVWIGRKVEERRKSLAGADRGPLVTGAKLPLFGRFLRLEIEEDRSLHRGLCRDKDESLVVRVPDSKEVKRVLKRWYVKKAHSYYYGRVFDLSRIIGVEVRKISVSSARTQWGSCIVRKGRISIQWRLALGPAEVADYVVAHELAHMKIRLHSDRFWCLVAKMDKDYREHRKWLSDNGYTLVL